MLVTKALETGWVESEWNPANFERVVLKYQPRIFRFIYSMTNEIQLAQDLTQDTFLLAYRALVKQPETAKTSPEKENEFSPEVALPISAWLYTIARNATISEKRRRKGMQFSSIWQPCDGGGEYEISNRNLLASGSDLENHYIARDELKRAMTAVGKERLTALLLYFDGYSYQEISQLINISLSSVKSQIFRAKESLRRNLG